MSYIERKELFSLVEEKRRLTAAQKFMIWVALGVMTMLFAAFTSAYGVRMAEGHWETFALPQIYLYSTITILISSLTLWQAHRLIKHDEVEKSRVWLLLTFLLGAAFLIMQWMGFVDMVSRGIYFVGHVAGSYVYVLAAMHALHVILGLGFIAYVLIASFRYKVNARRDVAIYVTSVLWHFLAALWLYLYLFMRLTR